MPLLILRNTNSPSKINRGSKLFFQIKKEHDIKTKKSPSIQLSGRYLKRLLTTSERNRCGMINRHTFCSLLKQQWHNDSILNAFFIEINFKKKSYKHKKETRSTAITKTERNRRKIIGKIYSTYYSNAVFLPMMTAWYSY